MWRRALLLAVCGAAWAQVGAFEVATIKPSAGDTKGRYITMPSAHRFVAHNHTLKSLVGAAYNLTPKTIFGGPEWAESEHFDVLAGTPGEARPRLDEQMAMLRGLLAERFGLEFHRESREMAYYALRVAKGGAKLRPARSRRTGPSL
jgi:uncharacterized protein (TIGR03435 family)